MNPLDIKPSEIIGRLLRQETPEALGVSTLDHVETAMDAGNLPLAKDRLEYARLEWQVVHDMYVNWSWSFFSYIQQKHGDAALEQAYRDILGSYYKSRYDAVMAASTETQLQLSVEGLRGHLMGEGRRGDVPVTDEGKRWRIDLQPCGSGGVAIKRIRAGKEPNPQLFGFAEEAHDWTWGKKNVCHYCGHCAFVNEILAIEHYGHPLRVTEYSGADDGHCTWYIYKDPKDIPAEYYERVGKEAPAHAPRLADEEKL